ncbi:MAG: NAD(P)-binding domain-containing protein [Yoonia sp.]|uniref:NAD(P)-binding domain-containing protein n=1 Tax=Yoonia sp. TaxID=2212373 RepID=UPI003EF7B41C
MRDLEEYNRSVHGALARLNLPRPAWVPTTPKHQPDTLLDVLVIGAGQFGTGATAALKLAGIESILMIDQAEEGREGPWLTSARMPTLRSPKTLSGLSFGIPSLTFQSWFRAAYGMRRWNELYKIPNDVWQEYLLWVRQVLALPTLNQVKAESLIPQHDHVEIPLSDGKQLRAKRVIVATGRASTGGWARVDGVSANLWPDLAAHTMQDINFEALIGKKVTVIGAGSAAWDNAATALETGAASVDMYVRRKALPQINKGRASSGIGYLKGWHSLPDSDRWRLAHYLGSVGVPPPFETVQRTLKTPGLSVHFGVSGLNAMRKDDQVKVAADGAETAHYDFLILGSGFRVDLSKEPLFSKVSQHILNWGDKYQPPAELRNSRLAAYPYIGPDFELLSKANPVLRGPSLERIHLFNSATWVSTGSLASDIPSLDIAPDRLAHGIVQKLFAEDFEHHFTDLKSYDEHELEPTPFYSPGEQ